MQNFREEEIITEEECLLLKNEQEEMRETKEFFKEGSQVEEICESYRSISFKEIDLKIDGPSDLMHEEFITHRKKYYLLFFIQGILNELPYEITLVASQDLVSQFHKENMISVVP